MVLAAIVINQMGKPAGSPSQSRDDLSLGVSVVLTNNDNTGVVSWFWEFISRPVGSLATISGASLPSASFVPDVRGSYLIKLTVDETPSNPATDTRVAAIKTSFLGIRKPATSERKEFDTVEGWSAAQQAMIDAIDADAELGLKRNGSNQPSADINWGARKITNLGGLQNEGALRLGETTNPSAVSDKGFLYAKDDSGDTELFYMDDGGAVVQITRDGQLYPTVPSGPAGGQLGGTYPNPDVRGLRETAGPTLLTLGVIPDGQVLMRQGSTVIGSVMSTGGKVKVRVDDAADGYLHDKLLTGPGLSFAIGNPGGDETLTIDAYGEAKVSSADTTFGYLETKVVAGANIVITRLSPGGDERLSITATGTGFDGYNVKVSIDDTTPGFLEDKLVAGANITLTVLSDGYDEALEITGSPSNTLGQSYDQGGPGAGREILVRDRLPVQLTGDGYETLSTDGYLGLAEMSSDPSPLGNKGLIYTQDDGYGRTGLYYMDQAGKESLVALDGYAGALAGYDELDPATTTGNETSLFLSRKPRNPASLLMFRNGVLMRRVAALGASLTEYVWDLDRLVTFNPTLLAGEWYSAHYLYNK